MCGDIAWFRPRLLVGIIVFLLLSLSFDLFVWRKWKPVWTSPIEEKWKHWKTSRCMHWNLVARGCSGRSASCSNSVVVFLVVYPPFVFLSPSFVFVGERNFSLLLFLIVGSQFFILCLLVMFSLYQLISFCDLRVIISKIATTWQRKRTINTLWFAHIIHNLNLQYNTCLLYTSDAADE